MRLASRRQRQNLLAAAFDLGIAHFDVARMYGLGAAERELGAFARSRRERLVIATKFGIDPAPASWMARLQGPARALMSRYPALRRVVKRHDSALQRRRYTAQLAQRSLERSLKELGTDYVDIFFVHDPRIEDDLAVEELRAFLEGARDAGRIRAWGIAGERSAALDVASRFPADLAMQVREDVFSRPDARRIPGQQPQITFGILSSALDRIVSHVRSSDSARSRWRCETGLDCSAAPVVASLLLQDSLRASADGVVLFSTTKPERIAAAVNSLESSNAIALQAFRDLISADLDARVENSVRD
jgi:hypothetical protein